MPRNMQVVSDLQDQAVAVLQEGGKMLYPDYLQALKDAGLESAIPYLPALRKVRIQYSLALNEDGTVSHYVEAL